MSHDKVAIIVYDPEGKLVDYEVSDDFMDYLRDQGCDLTKEEVIDILKKHTDKAEVIDENGNVIRPACTTIQ